MVVGEQRHGRLDHLDRAGDDAGAATEAGEPVPLTGIVALDELRLVLADVVPAFRQGGVVGRPIVCAEQAHAPGLQPAQQALQRGLVAPPAFPVDQPAGTALEGLPDPELAGFFWTKCQTSSISTTTARPIGSGSGQCARAWSLTQRITLWAETPRRLPVAFSDRPVQYSSTAAAFIAAGLPRGVVRVNCRPQPSQRQRCRPQAWPALISAAPPQTGQAAGCPVTVTSNSCLPMPFSWVQR